jgi:hypothetical protein
MDCSSERLKTHSIDSVVNVKLGGFPYLPVIRQEVSKDHFIHEMTKSWLVGWDIGDDRLRHQ